MKNNFAHPLRRLLALVLDQVIILALILGLVWLLSKDLFLALIIGGLFAPVVLSLLVISLTAKVGGSPGQIITGLKVVDKDGKKLSWKMAFFRAYIGSIVSGSIFGLGNLWMFWDEKRQGWHDKISGSFVVVRKYH